ARVVAFGGHITAPGGIGRAQQEEGAFGNDGATMLVEVIDLFVHGTFARPAKDVTQQPAFSANNPPAHDRETGRKSSPGAGLRGDEGVKSAHGPSSHAATG